MSFPNVVIVNPVFFAFGFPTKNLRNDIVILTSFLDNHIHLIYISIKLSTILYWEGVMSKKNIIRYYFVIIISLFSCISYSENSTSTSDALEQTNKQIRETTEEIQITKTPSPKTREQRLREHEAKIKKILEERRQKKLKDEEEKKNREKSEDNETKRRNIPERKRVNTSESKEEEQNEDLLKSHETKITRLERELNELEIIIERIINNKVIPDPNLEYFIRRTLNKPEEKILTSDLRKLEYLSIFPRTSSKDVKYLQGLEYATNLKELDIHHCNIDNYEPILNLKKLDSLRISDTNISSIRPFIGLNNLKELHICHARIESITEISQFKKLKKLKLRGNKIKDITPLSNLKKLKSLSLGMNQISDISPLENLKKTGILNNL